MEDLNCTNYSTCRLVVAEGFPLSQERKILYMNKYCKNGKSAWLECKRYTTKAALGFCPDYVLPDSTCSLSEIIDQFDNENGV